MGAAYDFLQKKEVPPPPPIEPPDPPEGGDDDNNEGGEDEWSAFAILALFLGLILSLVFIYSQT